ncbi:MAG: RluA family pseudouridine synthase [Planctomycetota bacterium]|nr:MAG: RluA family pseudouridine synthase [Planctomycetota bacterium]
MDTSPAPQSEDSISAESDLDEVEAPVLSASEPVSLTVEARAHGWRVDHYLARLFPNYSRELFKRALEQSAVQLNGLPVKASRRLRVNDRVSVRLPELPDNTLQPEDLPIQIVYEDDSLAVINKPADMVTHPGKGNFRGTLAAAVQFHFDKLSSVAGQLRPGIVHRLDRDTTGVIVIAKDNTVHNRLSAQFEQRVVKKEYRAIVRGALPRDADYIRTWIKSHPKNHEKMMTCAVGEQGGREAVTFYEVIERFRGFTYVRLLPETGRTHQLRVHMLELKCPIIADRLYAGHSRVSRGDLAAPETIANGDDTLISRQALHAFQLRIRHPVTDQEMQFEAALPSDIEQTLEALRTYRKLSG